jgi:hypothetical protein
MEVIAIATACVALGAVRPRRTTLLVAGLPTLLAFAWLVMHEEIPGDRIGLADLLWYAGMSVLVGAGVAFAIAVGIASRRACGAAPPRSRLRRL